MWYLKKIIAWLLVFAILIFSLCVPSFAVTDPAPTDSRGDFYDWLVSSGSLDEDRPGGSFGNGYFGQGGGRPSKEQYNEWVSTLPATGYSSDGSLLWSPSLDYISFYLYKSSLGGNSYAYCPHSSNTSTSGLPFLVSFNCNNKTIQVTPKNGGSSFDFSDAVFYYKDVYPIDGYYLLLETASFSGYYLFGSTRTEIQRSYLDSVSRFCSAS